MKPTDNLVVIDDSIVRGTTLRRSIIRILARLNPKKIIIVSTAPQIRYPDCYGIDMSELGKFIAFEAAVALLKERGQGELLEEVYRDCCREELRATGPATPVNHVRKIYEPFTPEEISAKIVELVYPRGIEWQRPGADHLPDDREPARRRAQPHRRLVFHRQVSDARRLPGGEPGLRELFRKTRGPELLRRTSRADRSNHGTDFD